MNQSNQVQCQSNTMNNEQWIMSIKYNTINQIHGHTIYQSFWKWNSTNS